MAALQTQGTSTTRGDTISDKYPVIHYCSACRQEVTDKSHSDAVFPFRQQRDAGTLLF
jgi:hypothetical protein